MGALKYTVEILAPIAKDSVSYAEVIRKLGLRQAGGTQTNIKRLIARHGLDTLHFTGMLTNRGDRHRGGPDRKSAEQALVQRDPARHPEKASVLRRVLVDLGRLYECGYCGQGSCWNSKPLDLQIDHINGDRWDNREDNLRFACPNCHSQTETFGAKNRKSKKEALKIGLTSVDHNK